MLFPALICLLLDCLQSGTAGLQNINKQLHIKIHESNIWSTKKYPVCTSSISTFRDGEMVNER